MVLKMRSALEDKPMQKVICVNSEGIPNGKIIDRKTAHTTPGVKHLAIQIFVFNLEKELILHERPKNKVGGGKLDAPTTHVLAGEKPNDSALRCLNDEYGILSNVKVTILDGYSYAKDYGDGTCENEYCLAAYLIYDGKIKPNKEHVIKLAAFSANKVAADVSSGSDLYPVWFKKTLSLIKEHDPRLFDLDQLWLF